MGLFDKYFANNKKANPILNRDLILHLITISHQMFDKEKIKFEKAIFGDFIIHGDIPIEYQDDEIILEQEFKNRYAISSGIISIAIMESLIEKHMNNSHNNNLMISIKQFIFTNILKTRKKILTGPNIEDFHFVDQETEILDTPENFKLFSERINLLSSDLKSFVENSGSLNYVRNYFGISMGQVMPRIMVEKDEELGNLVKSIIRKIFQNFEMYFIDLL